MNVQVLVSALNKNPRELVKQMNLSTDAIIINQCDKNEMETFEYCGYTIRAYSFAERGVGLSRNSAFMRADSDICLFSDEDIVYEEGYGDKIISEFEQNPDADMLVFNIEVDESRRTYHNEARKRVHLYNCGRYGAVSFAVKREALLYSGVTFSLLFGGGARYASGEDSLFIKDFIKKGYHVYTSPVTIGREESGESTWFTGYDEKFFHDRGVLYHYLYGKMAYLLALRFLYAHKSILFEQMNLWTARKYMFEGIQKARR